MRILHAADLHLGRTLHERDLIPDQRAMFDAMLGALASRKVDVLLLAGDIYDRAIPPPEAIALFDDFLSRVAGLPDGPVIIAIPGNHDSAARLSFGAGLFARAGLHIRTRPEEVVAPIEVKRHGEKALFWALPYLNPGAFPRPAGPGPVSSGAAAPGDARERAGEAMGAKAQASGTGTGRRGRQAELFEPLAAAARGSGADCGAGADCDAGAAAGGGEVARDGAAPAGDAMAAPSLRSQSELFAEAMERITPLLDPESPNVLVAHCFAAGGAAGGSERSFIGGAEEVPVSSFEAFDYAALGHLHRRQAAGPRARYPGTPLAYSFDEAAASPQKGFLLVEVSKGSFTEELVALEPLHRLTRVEGSYDELSAPGAFSAARGDYVEARLTDLDPVLDPVDALRTNFPNLLSVRQAAFELAESLAGTEGGAAAVPAQGAACRGPEAVMADFRSFYSEVRRAEPDAETEDLFAELVKEAEHASP